MSAVDMQTAVDEMDETLVMPPDNVWNNLDAIAIRNSPGAFSVRVDLWNIDGRSDLSVEMTLYSNHGAPVIEIDNIHVM